MLNELSVTQFLGQIVTEAEYYRCDAFILMERICKELIDREFHRDDEIDCIIASRKCGFEWILPMIATVNHTTGKAYFTMKNSIISTSVQYTGIERRLDGNGRLNSKKSTEKQ